jgi:hypothetical protein
MSARFVLIAAGSSGSLWDSAAFHDTFVARLFADKIADSRRAW